MIQRLPFLPARVVSSSDTVMPNAAATLVRTAREGFALADSMRRTCAGSMPKRSAAASIVQPLAARSSLACCARDAATRRNRAVSR
jgi:hypothetical protein